MTIGGLILFLELSDITENVYKNNKTTIFKELTVNCYWKGKVINFFFTDLLVWMRC